MPLVVKSSLRGSLAASLIALSALATLSPLLMAPAAHAEELSAQQIIDKALSQGAAVAFQRGTARLDMTIVNPRGEAKRRALEVKAMRGEDGLLRSLVRFTKPADVAGIAFLVREKKGALPDQYVYVPAAKVVRRVAAGNAGSSFFGSDFTFGDLMPIPDSERDKVKLTRLADAEVGKQPTYVIEAVPHIEGAPYSKIVTYVDKKLLTPLKIEFFDPAGKALKTLTVKKLKKIKGELIPIDVVMKNTQTGSRTELVIEAPDPEAKLSDADFTEEAMQR